MDCRRVCLAYLKVPNSILVKNRHRSVFECFVIVFFRFLHVRPMAVWGPVLGHFSKAELSHVRKKRRDDDDGDDNDDDDDDDDHDDHDNSHIYLSPADSVATHPRRRNEGRGFGSKAPPPPPLMEINGMCTLELRQRT